MRATVGLLVPLLLAPGCASSSGSKATPPPPPEPPVVETRPAPGPTAAAPAPSARVVAASEPAPVPTDPAEVARANALGWQLLAKTGRPTDNALVSAPSVREALAPLLVGARGTTATEMAQALGLPTDPTDAVRAELATWESARGRPEAGTARGVDLAVANRVWLDDAFALLPDYAAGLGRPEIVDFAKPETRGTINGWVSEQTRGKIPELLPAGAVDARTRLVVTNAIWFKGRWALPFPKAETRDEPFRGAKTAAVPTMHLTDSLRYAAGSGLEIVELGYADSGLALDVILPNGTALPAADTAAIDRLLGTLASTRVRLSLPKLRFTSGGPLKDALAGLGMKLAFGDRADFSGMVAPAAAERLSVGQVFHRTFLALDEAGTEAAAATGTVLRTTAMPLGPVVDFKADRPFWLVLRDTRSGRVLFTGRVTDPKAV